VCALLAAMQLCPALRAWAVESGSRRQRYRAVITARRRHGLHEPRQTRACNVQRGTWPGRLWTGCPIVPVGWSAVAVKVTVLTVLAVGVHADLKPLCSISICARLTDGESWAIFESGFSLGKTCGCLEKRTYRISAPAVLHPILTTECSPCTVSISQLCVNSGTSSIKPWRGDGMPKPQMPDW
jgi:hypothetical protein